MEVTLFIIFAVAALVLAYLFVIGVWKGLNARQARVMVAANCVVLWMGVFVYHTAREEDNLQYQESLADLMRSVEYAILSDHGSAAVSILHVESNKLDEADPGTWVSEKIYDRAMAALDKLNTGNAATKAAEDREK